MKWELNKRLQTIGKKIKKEVRAEKVILFGSYAKGNASADSDVDLLVIAPSPRSVFSKEWRAFAVSLGTCGMVFPFRQSF
jgi:predicted nucleotidyltransferase